MNRRLFLLMLALLVAPIAGFAQEKKDPAPTLENMISGMTAKEKGNPKEPIKTEIFADQAFFDAQNNVGTFTGNVKVTDPRFSMQSDKLTVYINKDQKQGLERAVAEGNVGVVRERPAPKDGVAERSIGRAESAVYTAGDGNVVLSGTPRVQQGMNMHVAISPETVMVLNAKGQLETRGPSRTELHQEKKKEAEASPAPSPTP